MRALFHMASFIGDGLPNFEIRKAKKGSDLLVRTPQLGAALAKALGKRPAALMRGHGSVVIGENLQRAVGRSIYLEMSARMQMQALLLSKRITFLDAAEVKASAPVQDYKRAWPLWRDKALARARADRR
jgi:HCOMODA/2-hydroxy-3-carboxy-muconic semialdehyde decarboxylase